MAASPQWRAHLLRCAGRGRGQRRHNERRCSLPGRVFLAEAEAEPWSTLWLTGGDGGGAVEYTLAGPQRRRQSRGVLPERPPTASNGDALC